MSYRPYEPQQEMLLPASLQDWLPKVHLAYFIGDTVDALSSSHWEGASAVLHSVWQLSGCSRE